MLKSKLILFFIILFLGIFVYKITELNKKQRISTALELSLNELETNYKILLYHQKIIADVEQISLLQTVPRFLEIYSQINEADENKKILLRKELYKILIQRYELLKTQGVLPYQFLLKNNTSFLRMHKPNKFGDDLTKIRKDFAYVNEIKKLTRGFAQGRTVHAFRNAYPIFDKNGIHLGAMEVSFSSDSFQEYLTNVINIHTHFIVNKQIFDAKAWSSKDLVLKYFQSSEHKDYMISMNSGNSKEKCIDANAKLLDKVKSKINIAMEKGEKFSLYVNAEKKDVKIISFLPIKDIENTKNLAWFISYKDSDFIKSILFNTLIVRTVSFIFLLILWYLIYWQLKTGRKTKLKNILVNDILNVTDNIMFVTDFKVVTYSNRKFKHFFDVNNEREFNKKIDYRLFNIFVKTKDNKVQILVKDNESITHFIRRIIKEKRVVNVLDRYKNLKAFNINITKINYTENEDYLVTLNDITKFKEEEGIIQNKAYTDSLTKVFNRNKFDEILTEELTRNTRYERNLSMAMFDIDHFKRVNDTYGHLIGDEILIMLAQNVNSSIRETDTLARWGGEEFVILFPETSEEEAQVICEKLRKKIEKLSHLKAGKVTVSFGLTQYIKNDDINSIFKRCDDALYHAKESGRNRVCTN